MNDKRRPARNAAANLSPAADDTSGAAKPSAPRLLETPGAFLTRGHLAELGLGRRAVDSIFRSVPVVTLPGYSRPMILVADYLALVADCTHRGDRVR